MSASHANGSNISYESMGPIYIIISERYARGMYSSVTIRLYIILYQIM